MSGKDPIEQLVYHLGGSPLRGGKIAGLPNEWFSVVECSSAESVSTEPAASEAASQGPASDGPASIDLCAGDTYRAAAAEIGRNGASNGAMAPLPQAESALSSGALPPPGAAQFQGYSLDQLREAALGCTRCRLCDTRNKVVFGVGKTDSPLIAFVGEGPGADEDRIGEPFVGRAGELLTAAITKGLGLRREDVYIANVVKCRPPQNRAPLPDEVQACTQFLYRQLQLINPKVIVTLGQPAQLALSRVNLGITKLRGQWQSWSGFRLMPTFHPAYLLRNPAAKKEFWQDLKAVMAELGINRS